MKNSKEDCHILIKHDDGNKVTLDIHGTEYQISALLTCAVIDNPYFREAFAQTVNVYISEGIKEFERVIRKTHNSAPPSGIIAKA